MPASLVFRFGLVFLPAPVSPPFIVHRRHEGEKPLEGLAIDLVAPGICIQRHEADRCFAAKGAVLAIALEQIPGTEVKGMPVMEFSLGRWFLNQLPQPRFVVASADQLREPFLLFRCVRLPP